MKILILGGSGMIGHTFLQSLGESFDVKVTLQGSEKDYLKFGIFNNQNAFYEQNALDLEGLSNLINLYNPQCIVNCVGITKQICVAKGIEQTIEVNSLFPHQIKRICEKRGVRLIHLSTDCVFSGKKGFYNEKDFADAEDLYGRSKILGEVEGENCLTLRKSTVGLELSNTHGLIEWFISQKQNILGYKGAIYSGLSTRYLATIVGQIIKDHRELSGIMNLASAPISKYDLLCKLRNRIEDFDIEIIEDDKINIDRSLDAAKFCDKTGIVVPSWDEMLDDLAKEINERKYDTRK